MDYWASEDRSSMFKWYNQRRILSPNQNLGLQNRPISLVRFGRDQPIECSDYVFFKHTGSVLWGSVILGANLGGTTNQMVGFQIFTICRLRGYPTPFTDFKRMLWANWNSYQFQTLDSRRYLFLISKKMSLKVFAMTEPVGIPVQKLSFCIFRNSYI